MSHHLHKESCEYYNNNIQIEELILDQQAQPAQKAPYQGQPVMNQPYPMMSQPMMNQQPNQMMNQQPYFFGIPTMPNQMMPTTQIIMIENLKICGLQIPHIQQTTALIFLIINIFIPGLGTILSGCANRNLSS